MTTGHGAPETDAVGGPTRHVPVLLGPVLEALGPKDGDVLVDGTFGAGGYTRALLSAADTRVVAIDRDPEAIAAGRTLEAEAGGRLVLVQGRFGALDRLASEFFGSPALDGVVLDVGVSSMQLDEAERGFSFRRAGPLDMRMERKGPSAADVVNTLDEGVLTKVIGTLGEERRARTVARAIVAARKDGPIETTLRLADIITGAIGRGRPGEIHPATRTFQALRILVNRELDELAEALAAAERALRPGGRLAVVTFHSLEDRIVKQFLASRSGRVAQSSRHLPERVLPTATFTLSGRRPILPDEAETEANPRARSAKLRAAIRTDAPARPLDREAIGLPDLPKFALPTGVL